MFAALRVSKESQSSEARSVVDTKIHLVQQKYIWFKYENTFSSNTNISTSRCHNRGRTKIIWNPIYKETTFPLSFPISENNVFPYWRSMFSHIGDQCFPISEINVPTLYVLQWYAPDITYKIYLFRCILIYLFISQNG